MVLSLLVGLAAWAGMAWSGEAWAEEAALAVARTVPGAAARLPRPLDADEAAHIRRVLSLRAHGRTTLAAREEKGLEHSILFGHVLAERYLVPGAHVSADELQAWLAQYGDQPDAPAIYSLLLPRLPHGASPPDVPEVEALGPVGEWALPPSAPDTGLAGVVRHPAIDQEVHRLADAGRTGAALDLVARTRGLDPVYAALLQAEIARRVFLHGDDAAAQALAINALHASGDGVGLAALVGGLAAWRGGRPDIAAPLFETAWQAPFTRLEDRVAGAFWAGRAALRLDRDDGHLMWLRIAAQHPLTFYGMIARRALGLDDGFVAPPPPPREPRNLRRETLGEADVAAVDATSRGHRAFALLQVGESARAEAELRCLWAESADSPALRRALLLVSRQAGLVGLAMQMADLLRSSGPPPADDRGFPVPRLTPLYGFAVDPALVYGITRLESDFDPNSISSAGARGLMQLMPATAVEVDGDPDLADAAIERLHDPALNLDLGQRFLVQLSVLPPVQGDLMRLLASYYSGPTAVSRWAGALRDGGDPLLFLESIPADDVRSYVRRGLTYAWVYAARFRLEPPGLDDLAAGNWPRFTPLQTRQGFLPQHLRP